MAIFGYKMINLFQNWIFNLLTMIILTLMLTRFLSSLLQVCVPAMCIYTWVQDLYQLKEITKWKPIRRTQLLYKITVFAPIWIRKKSTRQRFYLYKTEARLTHIVLHLYLICNAIHIAVYRQDNLIEIQSASVPVPAVLLM